MVAALVGGAVCRREEGRILRAGGASEAEECGERGVGEVELGRDGCCLGVGVEGEAMRRGEARPLMFAVLNSVAASSRRRSENDALTILSCRPQPHIQSVGVLLSSLHAAQYRTGCGHRCGMDGEAS